MPPSAVRHGIKLKAIPKLQWKPLENTSATQRPITQEIWVLNPEGSKAGHIMVTKGFKPNIIQLFASWTRKQYPIKAREDGWKPKLATTTSPGLVSTQGNYGMAKEWCGNATCQPVSHGRTADQFSNQCVLPVGAWTVNGTQQPTGTFLNSAFPCFAEASAAKNCQAHITSWIIPAMVLVFAYYIPLAKLWFPSLTQGKDFKAFEVGESPWVVLSIEKPSTQT